MPRKETVLIDSNGNADRAAELCKAGGDELVWEGQGGKEFEIHFLGGSPFVHGPDYTPKQTHHASGPIDPNAVARKYHYRIPEGDDGDVIINP